MRADNSRERALRAGCFGAAAALVAAVGFTGTAAAYGRPGGDAGPGGRGGYGEGGGPGAGYGTATPIKHLVVVFDENVSFDHYFGTYPVAANPPGEPAFHALAGTPSVNGLTTSLLTDNPNLSNPQRLDRSQNMTCDQDHGYASEQKAFDSGLMDQFVQDTGHSLTLAQCLANAGDKAPVTGAGPNYAVMDYYDGNTVTALWQYAQHFALSDNSYGTNFGPSTPGALNVTSAQTYGAVCGPSGVVYNAPACQAPAGGLSASTATPGAVTPAGPGTDYNDSDPLYDVCSNGAMTGGKYDPAADMAMGGPNIGTMLDQADVTWGWFQGGFAAPGYVPGQPGTDNLAKVCTSTHANAGGAQVVDYVPHHEPFQYYTTTANPMHPPTSVAMIGHQDQANHQYDLSDFWAAADAGNLPAVSFLKAAAYQDGHGGYSDPLDEQTWLVDTINRLEKLPSWASTAVVVNWDDSDGWYDHQMGPIVAQSQVGGLDYLTGAGNCGSNSSKAPNSEQARCGVGPRIPMLAISPWARTNFVDNTFSTQSSVVGFIEDNWLQGRRLGNGAADTEGTIANMFDFSRPAARPLFLDPSTGEPTGVFGFGR